jgi:hypothetical protein
MVGRARRQTLGTGREWRHEPAQALHILDTQVLREKESGFSGVFGRKFPVFHFPSFENSDLFRISHFGFRIWTPWTDTLAANANRPSGPPRFYLD